MNGLHLGAISLNLEMCDQIACRFGNKGVPFELGAELVAALDGYAADSRGAALATVGAQRAAQIGSVEAGSYANAVHLFPIGQR